MARIETKVLTTSDAAASSTGWIVLNTRQENFHVGFSVRKSGAGVAPVINIEGVVEQDPLDEASVASTKIFALASAVSTSATGTNVAGEITFPVAAVRLSTISGGSGASTLTFSVIQSGQY